MAIKTVKDLIRNILQAEGRNAEMDSATGMTPEQNNLDYRQILTEYYHLIVRPELTEIEVKQLDRILWLAESDDLLSLLIEEIDELSFQYLGLLDAENLQHLKQQEARVETLLIRTQTEDCQGNPSGQPSNCLVKPFAAYRSVLQDYRRLTSQSDLSEIEEKRLENILQAAESDDRLQLLIDQLETAISETEQHPASPERSRSTSSKNRHPPSCQRPRSCLPWLKLGVGVLLLALGTYYFRSNSGTTPDKNTRSTPEIETAHTVSPRNGPGAATGNTTSSITMGAGNTKQNSGHPISNTQANSIPLDGSAIANTIDSMKDGKIDRLIENNRDTPAINI